MYNTDDRKDDHTPSEEVQRAGTARKHLFQANAATLR